MQYQELQLTDGATLRCYLQDTPAEWTNLVPRPAVLVFPGGGYRECSPREGEPVALAFLAQGYQAFVLNYTTGEGASFAGCLAEAELALETLRDNAESWCLDAARIAVAGFSAGGHLAASLGTMGRVRPSALVLGYPCILEKNDALVFPVPGVDKQVDAHTPPSFIFATSDDGVVNAKNSLAFAAALAENGVPYELHMYQHGVHGLALAGRQTSLGLAQLEDAHIATWLPLCAAWLDALWF